MSDEPKSFPTYRQVLERKVKELEAQLEFWTCLTKRLVLQTNGAAVMDYSVMEVDLNKYDISMWQDPQKRTCHVKMTLKEGVKA